MGVFASSDNAEMAISELRGIGAKDADISYVYSSKGTVVTKNTGTKAGEGAASGVTAGAVFGTLAGLAVINGILPGLGTLFVAGPLATALGLSGVAATAAAGAMTGAAAGGLVGALIGFGVNEQEAKIYEDRVRLGDILVSTSTKHAEEARNIFAKYGASEIREYPI